MQSCGLCNQQTCDVVTFKKNMFICTTCNDSVCRTCRRSNLSPEEFTDEHGNIRAQCKKCAERERNRTRKVREEEDSSEDEDDFSKMCKRKGLVSTLNKNKLYKKLVFRHKERGFPEEDIIDRRYHAYLLEQKCHYCGFFDYDDYTYQTVDRKDSNVGYIRDNCVTSCLVCNRAKNDMGYEEYKARRKSAPQND